MNISQIVSKKKSVSMNSLQGWFPLLCAIVSITACNGARILAVFPMPSASHANVLQTISIELAERGHEIIVFDAYPAGKRINHLKNYREINLNDNKAIFDNFRDFLKETPSIFRLITLLPETAEELVNRTFSNVELKELISPKSNEKFDLIMIEWVMWDGLNALGYRFNAPVIGIMTVPISMFGFSIGLPFYSIDRPNYITGKSGDKTFFNRLSDFVIEFCVITFHHYTLYKQQNLIAHHFSPDYPHVNDLLKNVSLMLSVQDNAMPFPTLSTPNLVNIGGIHVARETNQQLSIELQNFLNNSENGAIYFSLGSTMPGNCMLGEGELKKIFIETFAEIPYRVIWKWEDDELPGKSKNVFISKWLPQRAILAHPATKAFIYQGGLQSTEEAIASAVPLIGIPIFGDQDYNVNKMVNSGVAIKLDINNLTKIQLKEAIMEVMNNKLYKKRMIEFRELINDRPYDVINNTMWWIEYVIRHKGAHHLRVARANYPFYQAQYFDVISFCLLILIIFNFIAFKIMKFILFRCCFGRKKSIDKFKQS